MRFDQTPTSAGACLLVLAVAAAASLACADFKRGAYWEPAEGSDDSGGGSAGELGYAADVHELMTAGCERCHGVGNSAGDTDFVIVPEDLEASRASTLAFVDLDAPEASRLLTKMAGEGHGGGLIFDERSDEYGLVLAWIEQGAPP